MTMSAQRPWYTLAVWHLIDFVCGGHISIVSNITYLIELQTEHFNNNTVTNIINIVEKGNKNGYNTRPNIGSVDDALLEIVLIQCIHLFREGDPFCHQLGKNDFVNLDIGIGRNHCSAGIIDTLTREVPTEPTFFLILRTEFFRNDINEI